MDKLEENYEPEIKYLYEKIIMFLENHNISLKTTDEYFYNQFKNFFFENSTLL